MLVAGGLEQTVERLGGLEALLTERGGNLSAGERQLFCLVRALLRQPQLLILDEATSRLDAASEAKVEALLGQERAGRAVLLVAHRLRTAQRADTILVMHRGKVVERGTHRELLALKGRYARLWALQQMREEEGGLHRAISGILGNHTPR
ncbi:MAG: hypothetical protein C0621_05540 [Desulfuromonas sp.]|nr:MAG: hypothetical protein C0621_05540 [Desulfuromonas sp.]